MKNNYIPVINSQGGLRFIKIKTARAQVSGIRWERRKKAIFPAERRAF